MTYITSQDEKIFEETMGHLAETILSVPEAELRAEAGEEAFHASASRVRQLLWTAVKVHRQQALYAALEEYRCAVRSLREREREFELPEDVDKRRSLLYSFFQRSPETQAFTVQHRDLKTMSDADLVSFLKQLHGLGALPGPVAKPPAPARSEASQKQAPAKDREA